MKGCLIGAGYFAQFQAEAWRRIDGVEISAVADTDEERAGAFARRFEIPRVYSSSAQLLDSEEPDFVDIATRPEAHLELVAEAAARGVPIICQKPMAPSWDECVQMVEVCESRGVRLLIHENWRWQPWYREIQRLLEAGEIGRVFQVASFWRTGDGRGPEPYALQPYFRRMPRLLVYETLVHPLDTFRFLQGEISRVSCRLQRINSSIVGEDQGLITLLFKNGVHGLIDANRITGPMPPPVAMGSLVVEGDGGVLRVAPDGHIFSTPAGEEERQLPFSPTREGYKGDSVRATQAHLIECLRSGRPAESEGRDYLRTVALVEACYQSAHSDQPVDLDSSPFVPPS